MFSFDEGHSEGALLIRSFDDLKFQSQALCTMDYQVYNVPPTTRALPSEQRRLHAQGTPAVLQQMHSPAESFLQEGGRVRYVEAVEPVMVD